jgi:hypothetical protein
MVHEVGANSRQVLDHGDVEPFKQIARTDAAQLQDLGGVDAARGQDDLLFRRDRCLCGRVVPAEHVYPLGRGLADLDLGHVAVDEQLQIGPVLDGVVVGLACRGPRHVLSVDADWLPARTEQVAAHAPVVQERVSQVL